jgi:high affinity Mn2+ porin
MLKSSPFMLLTKLLYVTIFALLFCNLLSPLGCAAQQVPVFVDSEQVPEVESTTETTAMFRDPGTLVQRESGPLNEKVAEGQPQRWSLHGQSTLIVQGYPGMQARYTGPNSLPTDGQGRETLSTDLYGGIRLWSGAEAHFDVLTWQGFGLNNTLGIEAFPNGEAYKAGAAVPRVNIARLFIRHTIALGGQQQDFLPGDQLRLGGEQDISRLTFTIGRFSPKDLFDNNRYANDPRTQFMNWGLMANIAWDYPSDALGYTTGAGLELSQPKWALRYGFFQIEHLRNAWTAEDQFLTFPAYSGAGDGPFFKSWGMAAEYERQYSVHAHPGTLRLLAYLNQAHLGSYQAALSVPGADISQTRAYRRRYGFGLNWEHEISKNIGVFSRVGWNDGRNESWMFTDINHSASLGISVQGEAWHRRDDTIGMAGVTSGISRVNQQFLAAGGTGVLDGDGALNYSWEKVFETYYDCKLSKNLHAAVDYQFITNPAFNRDRGPVSVFGARMHWEY